MRSVAGWPPRGTPVAGQVGGVAAAVAAFGTLRPHLVITRDLLADGSGLTLLRRLRTGFPGARVLALSFAEDRTLISCYLREGAAGVVHRSVQAGEFLGCVGAALAGHRAPDRVTTRRLRAHLPGPGGGHCAVTS